MNKTVRFQSVIFRVHVGCVLYSTILALFAMAESPMADWLVWPVVLGSIGDAMLSFVMFLSLLILPLASVAAMVLRWEGQGWRYLVYHLLLGVVQSAAGVVHLGLV